MLLQKIHFELVWVCLRELQLLLWIALEQPLPRNICLVGSQPEEEISLIYFFFWLITTLIYTRHMLPHEAGKERESPDCTETGSRSETWPHQPKEPSRGRCVGSTQQDRPGHKGIFMFPQLMQGTQRWVWHKFGSLVLGHKSTKGQCKHICAWARPTGQPVRKQ